MNIPSNCKNYFLSILLLLPIIISSCIKEENSDCSREAAQLEIRAHWTSPDSIPGGIRAVFYSKADNRYIIKDFPPAGGTINVPLGTYSILVLNNDSQKILYSNESSFTDYSASTSSTSVEFPHRPDITKNFSSPDNLWLASYTSYDVARGLDVIDVYPKHQVYQYYVVVTIEGIDHVKGAGGTVTGLQESILLHDHRLTPTIGSVLLEPSARDDGIVFAFRSFGVIIENSEGLLRHDITFLLNTDKKIYAYNIDITEALDSIRFGGTIYLKDMIVIDPDSPADGGFEAGIEDWDWKTIIVPLSDL